MAVKKPRKLGTPYFSRLGKSAESSAKPKKLDQNVLRDMKKAIERDTNSFRSGGRTYTVAGLASDLKPIMSPSDLRRFLSGEKVTKMRAPTAGSGRMDVVFAKDGALVSKTKRSKPKTNNKKKPKTTVRKTKR